MNAFAGVVAFALIWACVFLASLPWALRGQGVDGRDGDVAGADPGAPRRPALLRMAAISFAVSCGLFAVFAFGAVQGWFDPETWPTWNFYPSNRAS